ncbi:pyruvate formate-lyase-activating protein [Capilliphycus salinus ALCB114379]|uniref:pyruvate formate-lyase-activating protein n=1 Tax=Capilliphycus salinus TaxID=2768948 RepID=UPI0039A60D8B
MTLELSTLNSKTEISGRIHSIETCGTVDGPGIRFVIFTQGCLLRCQYCHNPDTRSLQDGKLVTAKEIFEQIKKYRSYMKASGGGVTISGGEPLLQPEFVGEVFRLCKQEGIHTALDTSGFPKFEDAKKVLEFVDLVLLDLKAFSPETYHDVTAVSLEPVLRFTHYLNEIQKPTWVRFVLVPHLTDNPQEIAELAQFVSTLSNVEKVEVLPFHKMGEYKWDEMGYEYKLKDTPGATVEQVQQAMEIFKQFGVKVE